MVSNVSTDLILNVLSSVAKRDRHKEDILTFLVGMVGSDGVLLASDRKHSRSSDVRTGFKAPKVFISADKQLAYCSSGDEIGNEIGRSLLEIKTGGSDYEFDTRIKRHINEVVSAKPFDPLGFMNLNGLYFAWKNCRTTCTTLAFSCPQPYDLSS